MPAKKQIRSTKKAGHDIKVLMARAKEVAPPPPKARKARYRGKLSKLGWQEAWAKIFENNELLPPDQRLSDPQIKLLIAQDFPHMPGIKKKLAKYTVQTQRNQYNKGIMHNHTAPPKVSFRYNDQGVAIRIGNGPDRPLTASERRKWVLTYNKRQAKTEENYANKRKGGAYAQQSPTAPDDPSEPTDPPAE